MLLCAALLLFVADDPTPTVAESLLEFARSNLGRKVGNGECATLAIEGLRKAGARVRFLEDGIEWGEPREALTEAQPGDVLQFSQARFETKTKLPRGGVYTQTFSFPRHTAILAAVKTEKGTTKLTILHQNAGMVDQPEEERRKVSEWTLDLKDLKEGSIKAYQPRGASR